MKRLVWFVIALPLIAASPEQAIRHVLDDQVAAWNRGDIPGFMEGYDKSESTTFVGSAITKGPAARGRLRFRDRKVSFGSLRRGGRGSIRDFHFAIPQNRQGVESHTGSHHIDQTS
jgi:hypothetical protein